jgi:hypothetical protein
LLRTPSRTESWKFRKKVDQLTDSIKGQVWKAGLLQTEVGQFASIHKAVEYSQLCRKVHFASIQLVLASVTALANKSQDAVYL